MTSTHLPNLTRSTQALRPDSQAGLTLIELLVSMFLTTLVILAAVATLSMTRYGFNAVDSASQLRDNARFATTMLQQLAVQAGYRDLNNATDSSSSGQCSGFATSDVQTPALPVEGADNAIVKAGSTAYATSTTNNGSDVLVLRANLVKQNCGDAENDLTVLNCQGLAQTVSATSASGFSTIDSYLFADYKSGTNAEPALYCGSYGAASGSGFTVQPMLTGVETFQVLYGVNTGADPNSISDTSAAYQYKRAAEITTAQWKNVRTIRIGMVLRSATTTATEKKAVTYYPLGEVYASDSDPGTKFQAPADGRLRQVATFTIELRNAINN